MKIFVPKETFPGEKRAGIIPQSVQKLTGRGAEITVEAGDRYGRRVQRRSTTRRRGAQVTADRAAAFGAADIVMAHP